WGPRARARGPPLLRRRAAARGRAARPSDVRVGEARLALRDELEEGVVDAGVDRWRLVLGEHPLPDLVRALGRLERAALEPPLARVVVRRRRPADSRTE